MSSEACGESGAPQRTGIATKSVIGARVWSTRRSEFLFYETKCITTISELAPTSG